MPRGGMGKLQNSNIVYLYDGSFDGLMCCVFESYFCHEIPLDIITDSATLFPTKNIITDISHAARVINSIPTKMGDEVLNMVKLSYLAVFANKERAILDYLRLGFEVGKKLPYLITNDVVSKIFSAVKKLKREKSQLVEFIRFSDFNGVLAAIIDPDNYVLPLLSPHFTNRLPNEQFLIYDRTHNMALIYANHKQAILPIDDYQMPVPDPEEQKYRALWRLFYNTVEVKPRHNEKCRMSHMPKKFWHNMTEFCTDITDKFIE